MSALANNLVRELNLDPPAAAVLKRALDEGVADPVEFVRVMGGALNLSPPDALALLNEIVAEGGTAGAKVGLARELSLAVPATKALGSIIFPYLNPGATHYDGVADYYSRPSPLAGLGVSTGMVFSGWFTCPNLPLDSSSCYLFASQDNFYDYPNNSDPLILLDIYNDTGYEGALEKTIVQADMGQEVGGQLRIVQMGRGLPLFSLNNNAFHHMLVALNCSTGAIQFYLDDVPITDVTAYESVSNTPFSVDLSVPQEWNVGDIHLIIPAFALDVQAGQFKGCMSELFWTPMAAASIPDFSISANRRKFISADLKPVNLGANGELPFGVPPIFYSPLGNGTNLGTGGNLAAVGTPSACDSHP